MREAFTASSISGIFSTASSNLFTWDLIGSLDAGRNTDDFAIHDIWDPEKPSLEHELDLENGIHGYKIKMRLNTPPESRESSSDEE